MAWVERHGKKSWRVRYRKDDDTLGSISGFSTKKAATEHAETLKSEQRRGTWIDPHAGKITLTDWSATWLEALDVAANTEAQYRSLLTNHILPHFGDTALSAITGIAVAAWAKNTRTAGYAPTTVATMVKVLSMLLADAAEDRLIPANPIRARRRRPRHPPRRPGWPTPWPGGTPCCWWTPTNRPLDSRPHYGRIWCTSARSPRPGCRWSCRAPTPGSET
jgi:hypothetical protein